MATKSARSINRKPAARKTEAVLPIRTKMNCGNGQLIGPRSVCTDSSGNILCSWGTFGHENGQFALLWGIAVNSTTGHIYVIGWYNHRVQEFAPTPP